MGARRIWLTCALLAIAVSSHAQSLEFATTTTTSTAGARAAVSADFNRDGWLDLATANTGRNTVAILLNRGDGTGFHAAIETPVAAGPFDLAAGDLNRDGVPDLVVATPDGHGIDVLLVGGDGRVRSRRPLAAGSDSRGLALADVTRDGVLDLVYTDYTRNRVVVLPGEGDGTFGVPFVELATGVRPQGVVAADFNHDGTVDIAVACTAATSLDLYYGGLPALFSRRAAVAGRGLNALTAADLNADGWTDLVATATATNAVVNFRGGNGGFAVSAVITVGAAPRAAATGDFNQDGRPDIAVATSGSNSATVLLMRRDGTLSADPWGDLPSGSGARAPVAGDFDNDGRLDLAVAAQGAARVWLHENVTAFVAPALSFHAQPVGGLFGPQAIADFNENGIPDVVSDRNVVLDGATTVRLEVDPQAFLIDVGAADYNADGHQDVVIAKVYYNPQGQQNVAALDLYAGDGRGQFRFVKSVEGMPAGINAFRTADLDRDGFLDIAAFSSGGRIYIKRGFGAGPFQQSELSVALVRDLEIGDVTRDGVPDLVVSSLAGLEIYPGDGGGGFGDAIPLSPLEVSDFALGDMNHDGRLDVVADDGSVVFVVLASGDGWAAAAEFPSTIPWDTAHGTVLGDFDNDGHLDVFSWGGTLLLGDGRGALGPPMPFDFETIGAFPVDFNRDGLLDLIVNGHVLLNERRAANRLPVANAGPDRTIPYHAQWVIPEALLSGVLSSDPDLHRLTYEWRDDTGAVIGQGESSGFSARSPGTYTFTLTVRDGRGGQSTDSVRVTIAAEPEIVLHAGLINVTTGGGWTTQEDASAASESRVYYPNSGAPKVTAPVASPSNYTDILFAPDPTQTYKLWVRLKADGNSWSNDSVFVQFTGSTGTNGQPAYRLGTTSGLAVSLEECSGCGVSGWGWEDDGWGAPNVNGVLLRFPQGGLQTLRIQNREDGVSIDQIVLSAVKYRTTRPGAAKNDNLILPRTQQDF